MTLLHAPVDGRLLSCTELAPEKRDFLVPFATFFTDDAPLLHLMLRPESVALYTPAAGILTHADATTLCFFIEGKQRVALWLHTPSGTALALDRGDFLPLVDAGAPLQCGQLLGRLEPVALRRGELCLSLLTALPHGARVRCRGGRLSGGRTPLLTPDRSRVFPLVESSRKNSD